MNGASFMYPYGTLSPILFSRSNVSLFRTRLYVLCFRFLIRRVLEVIVGTNIALALIQQWIIPSVVNSLIPFSVTDVTSKTAESIEHRTFFRFRVTKSTTVTVNVICLFIFLHKVYFKGHNAVKWCTHHPPQSIARHY